MKDFGDAEKKILQYFSRGTSVVFNGQTFTVELSGKATCQNGEPKTDIYVLLEQGDMSEEIKISYKKANADFLENKISAERAEQLFGENWKTVVEQSTGQITSQFFARHLIYKTKHKRTEKGAITLGWKFELMNKTSGELSGKIPLTPAQLVDVYAGTNLSDDKKHATVNGEVIENSGVATHILMGDNVDSAQCVIDNMVSIENYAFENPDIYFACKALNYRTFKQKFDGNRPLAVQVNWQIIDNKLTPTLIFDNPFGWNGSDAANSLKDCLSALSIETTDDINESNVIEAHTFE